MSTDGIGIVSPDDHLVEPPELWRDRLPAKYRESGPRVVRERGRMAFDYDPNSSSDLKWETAEDGAWGDVWYYENMRSPQLLPSCAAGTPQDQMALRPITFDEMRPGFYRQRERLADMDIAGVEAAVCFPNPFTRFCGQRFLAATDKDLALLCVKAYNDFMLDEWWAGSQGRLIPLCVIPLWDTKLAIAEVERVAARGVRAISFSELPSNLGLPSIHSGHWDELFATCDRSGVSLMMHIGSSSKFLITSTDAPDAVRAAVTPINSAMCMIDWLASGLFERFPSLKIILAECEIGWIPFFLQKLDRIWDHRRSWNEMGDTVPRPPSEYFRDHVFCCFFDDRFGVENIQHIGEDNIMFETDYPHQDTSWPDSRKAAAIQTAGLSADVAEKVLRTNALRLLQPV